VLIAPPSKAWAQWTARSETQNRPQRVQLVLDAEAGRVVTRREFADQPLLDRIVGTSVAAHEGQLFGWVNQRLGLSLLAVLLTERLLLRRIVPLRDFLGLSE
jgi:uncharacterized iron-regulated membrane protein